MERYAQQWIDNLLDGASRFGGADVRTMLAGAGVAAGSRVVDYGCGPGYFTLIAAELVGAAGKVYAVDLEPRMVDLVRRRSAAAGFGNCEAVLTDGSRGPGGGRRGRRGAVRSDHALRRDPGRPGGGGARRPPAAQAGRQGAESFSGSPSTAPPASPTRTWPRSCAVPVWLPKTRAI